MTQPSIPQGTRDFEAATVHKRNYIFSIIRNTFELYGFQPLETPAMENLETLMGKYGEEGDQLIFKILNNGLNLPLKKDKARESFEKILNGISTKEITERALRYDLTIPFARWVAMHHGQIAFPYRRYQMQPVWRADRPQRGRYREFYQCDADIVGSHALINEVEFASLYQTVFQKLKIPIEIKINSRKILSALGEICEAQDKVTDITVAIDKLDKIGIDNVKAELQTKGLQDKQIENIEKYLSISGSNKEKIAQAKILLGNTENGRKGLEEIEYVLSHFPDEEHLCADFTLARGLNYYTGIIFEIKVMNVKMGSIGGGGRYDDLTGLFGVPGIPGVGISFGVDRIYDVMEELNLFPAQVIQSSSVLFFNLGEQESRISLEIMNKMRSLNIRCEIFHENAKFDKQFKYAQKKAIPVAIIIGSREKEEGTCTIKHLQSGQQQTISQKELLENPIVYIQ